MQWNKHVQHEAFFVSIFIRICVRVIVRYKFMIVAYVFLDNFSSTRSYDLVSSHSVHLEQPGKTRSLALSLVTACIFL